MKQLFLLSALLVGSFWATETSGQRPKLSDFERYNQSAEGYFQRGEYEKAVNLWQRCLDPTVVEDATRIQPRLAAAEAILKMQAEAKRAIQANNTRRAIDLYEEIINPGRNPPLNPSDRAIRRDLTQLRSRVVASQPTDDDRMLAQADHLFRSGNLDAARQVLRVVGPMRELERKTRLEAIDDISDKAALLRKAQQEGRSADAARIARQLQETHGYLPPQLSGTTRSGERVTLARPSVQADEAGYRRTLAEARQAFARACGNYAEARRLYRAVLAMPGFGRDREAKNRLDYVGTIEQSQRNLAAWQDDPSKRSVAESEYLKLTRLNPADKCLRQGYFGYVRGFLERRRANRQFEVVVEECLKLRQISEPFYRQNNIQAVFQEATDSLQCRQKTRFFNQQADRFRRASEACNLSGAEARTLLADLQAFVCQPPQVAELARLTPLLGAIEQNDQIRQTYLTLKTEGDSLLALGECQAARQRFDGADGLQTSCGSLAKNDLRRSIERCDSCLARLCFDTLYAKGLDSKARGYYRDALTALQKALACPQMPEARRPTLEALVADLECRLKLRDCSVADNNAQKAPRALFKLDVYASGTFAKPAFTPTDGKTTPLGGWGGAGGLRLHYVSFRGVLDAQAGIGFRQQRFYVQARDPLSGQLIANAYAESFRLSTFELPLVAALHMPRTQPGAWRPFVAGGMVLGVPVGYQFKKAISASIASPFVTLPTADLNSSTSWRFGLGIERQGLRRGWQLGAYYQAQGGFFKKYPYNSEIKPDVRTTLTMFVVEGAVRFW